MNNHPLRRGRILRRRDGWSRTSPTSPPQRRTRWLTMPSNSSMSSSSISLFLLILESSGPPLNSTSFVSSTISSSKMLSVNTGTIEILEALLSESLADCFGSSPNAFYDYRPSPGPDCTPARVLRTVDFFGFFFGGSSGRIRLSVTRFTNCCFMLLSELRQRVGLLRTVGSPVLRPG